DDFLKCYLVEQLRFWIAKNLWHSPLDYTEGAMIEAKTGLEKIEELLRKLRSVPSLRSKAPYGAWRGNPVKKILLAAKADFYANLADDFNTPKAFATLFDFIKEINVLLDKNEISKKDALQIITFFEGIDKIFGIINFKKLKTSNVP